MKLIPAFVVVATAVNGMLSGGSLEATLAKIPARRRIGNVAYATFARGNDLGNGLFVYPVWAISAALLVCIATGLAYVSGGTSKQLLPLTLASLTSIFHFLATAKAAPVMLSIRTTPNDEAILKEKLDRFERWHAIRMTFQVLTYFFMLWALVVTH